VTNFRPHPAQLRALEAIEQGKRVILAGGMRTGRRFATELAVIANASSPAEAQLCLEDLEQHGIALQDGDGRRVDPTTKRTARLRMVRFDEEKRK
jgi:hypothetical protein